MTHKAVRAENIPFSAASKDIWRRIKAQRRTCDLLQHGFKEFIGEEQDVDAAIEEPPETPLSEQTAAKEPSEEKPEELPNA